MSTWSEADVLENTKYRDELVRKEVAVLMNPAYRDAAAHENILACNLCYGDVVVPSGGRVGECFYLHCKEYCEGRCMDTLLRDCHASTHGCHAAQMLCCMVGVLCA